MEKMVPMADRPRAASAGPTTANALRKEVMLVHNLQLLGYAPASGASTGRGGTSGNPRAGDTTTTATALTAPQLCLHPAMFDRPNEKMLFQILHFLIRRVNPDVEGELRFCWPVVTPHDKSNFKRLVQATLQQLEKQGVLPIGSSQASRLNAGSGPRIVDLVWRLSTYAMKMQLHRDFTHYDFAQPPNRDAMDSHDAINLLRARIAMISRHIKEAMVRNASVHEEWATFASVLSSQIQETTMKLHQVYDEQNRLESTVDHSIHTQAAEYQRATQSRSTSKAWEAIDTLAGSDEYLRFRQTLATALHHHDNSPCLDAKQLRPQKSFGDKLQALNLADIVRNADSIIQLTRHRLLQTDARVTTSTTEVMFPSIAREVNTYVTTLTSTIEQLRLVLRNIRDSNDTATNGILQELAVAKLGATNDSPPPTICPPTPAEQQLQESDLILSLKKCSMTELRSASSHRGSDVGKQCQVLTTDPLLSTTPETNNYDGNSVLDEHKVFRRLNYEIEDDHNEKMEL